MYLAALIASFCAIQSVVADVSFSKDTKNCKVNGNKATPAISCECKTSDGNWVSCTAGIGSNFVNEDHDLESRPDGSAPATCTGFNLKKNVLGANCGGTRIALIYLEDACSVNDGKLVCSKKGDTREPTTTPCASKATSTNYSTGNPTPDTIASSGSGQNSASSPLATSTAASSTPESQTTVSASETTSGTSRSTDGTETDSCGMKRRSRIMAR